MADRFEVVYKTNRALGCGVMTREGAYDPFVNHIPVFMKLATIGSRPISTWTEQEIMEYSFMTGQGWTM